MNSGMISRRDVMLAVGALADLKHSNSQKSPGPLMASEVVDRIRAQVGVPWRTETVDKIVAGSPDTRVLGIATTMMATLDVLKRATLAGLNMVITHETPFYLHQDKTVDLQDDPTLQFKLGFIREHNLAVFHFHDRWHARKPDGRHRSWHDARTGLDRAWRRARPTPVHICQCFARSHSGAHKNEAGCQTMRVIGDPKLPIKNALASWGYVSRMPGIEQFRETGLNLFIGGETREWEFVEYVQDSIETGDKKALILIGHLASEQTGMKFCAEWLRLFFSEVPIRFVPASEPFWTPLRRIEGHF